MDLMAMQLSTFGDTDGHYPTDVREFAVQCKTDKQRTQWISSYVDKCLTGLTYDVTSMAIKDIDTVLKKYCDSPKLGKLYISWSRCGNLAINQTVHCWNKYIVDMEQLNQEKSKIINKDKMPLICCIYHRFDTCVEESFARLGENVCSSATVSGLHSILTEISGQMIENFCGDYQADNDKCDTILNGKYQYLNDIKLAKKLSKSPLNAFIRIIDSSPEFVDYFKADRKESSVVTVTDDDIAADTTTTTTVL